MEASNSWTLQGVILVTSRLVVETCPERFMQVTCGQPFTYDHVFGHENGSNPGELYDRCVYPLVQGLFRGYNATVFAYGQTGSGKTYTMGSAFSPGNPSKGVIPKVMEAIFERIATAKDTTFNVRVGFVEIHRVSRIDSVHNQLLVCMASNCVFTS